MNELAHGEHSRGRSRSPGGRDDRPEKCHDGLVTGVDVEHLDLQPGDERTALVQLALDRCRLLGDSAAVASFGKGPVNVRWTLVHMIDETARHAGHLDLLHDALRTR
jgi:hypothetical protein